MSLNSNNSACSSTATDAAITTAPRINNIEELHAIVAQCETSANYEPLQNAVRWLFSKVDVIKNSFLIDENGCEKMRELVDAILVISRMRMADAKKEEKIAEESDQPKYDCYEESGRPKYDCYEESMEIAEKKEVTGFNRTNAQKFIWDICKVKQVYEILLRCPTRKIHIDLLNSYSQLLENIMDSDILLHPLTSNNHPYIINSFIILLENPDLTSRVYSEFFCNICAFLGTFPLVLQAIIVRHLACWGSRKLHGFLVALHQLINDCLMSKKYTRDGAFYNKAFINNDATIISATRTMKMVYYASIYGGKWDEPLLLDLPPEDFAGSKFRSYHFHGPNTQSYSQPPFWDPLAKVLGIHPLDAKEPLVPLKEFNNHILSCQLDVAMDIAYYTASNSGKFSFMYFSFILTPATKAIALFYDSRIKMFKQKRMCIDNPFINGYLSYPNLFVRIRREALIEDTSKELGAVALFSPNDLKKQLVVEFINEHGIDEGGVSNEFFQLITKELFGADYGIFGIPNYSDKYWFNISTFESDCHYMLAGIIFGLAIYNNSILDLNFPPVVYKKLCGKQGTLHDLKGWNKSFHKSMQDILEYEGDDMEDVFGLSFCVSYTGILDRLTFHNLLPHGNDILVSQSTKKNFVKMYTDYLLNTSVERQFFAFRRGFLMVTHDSPINQLFRPDELEELVCGVRDCCFLELKNVATYDNGYTESTPIIEWFWDIVIHELSEKDKKLFLQFTTGSDRIPAGGFAHLGIKISRHGSDTNRLPTASTCFNLLLLPEYSSKEKLKERFLKSISNAEGFGLC